MDSELKKALAEQGLNKVFGLTAPQHVLLGWSPKKGSPGLCALAGDWRESGWILQSDNTWSDDKTCLEVEHPEYCHNVQESITTQRIKKYAPSFTKARKYAIDLWDPKVINPIAYDQHQELSDNSKVKAEVLLRRNTQRKMLNQPGAWIEAFGLKEGLSAQDQQWLKRVGASKVYWPMLRGSSSSLYRTYEMAIKANEKKLLSEQEEEHDPEVFWAMRLDHLCGMSLMHWVALSLARQKTATKSDLKVLGQQVQRILNEENQEIRKAMALWLHGACTAERWKSIEHSELLEVPLWALQQGNLTYKQLNLKGLGQQVVEFEAAWKDNPRELFNALWLEWLLQENLPKKAREAALECLGETIQEASPSVQQFLEKEVSEMHTMAQQSYTTVTVSERRGLQEVQSLKQFVKGLGQQGLLEQLEKIHTLLSERKKASKSRDPEVLKDWCSQTNIVLAACKEKHFPSIRRLLDHYDWFTQGEHLKEAMPGKNKTLIQFFCEFQCQEAIQWYTQHYVSQINPWEQARINTLEVRKSGYLVERVVKQGPELQEMLNHPLLLLVDWFGSDFLKEPAKVLLVQAWLCRLIQTDNESENAVVALWNSLKNMQKTVALVSKRRDKFYRDMENLMERWGSGLQELEKLLEKELLQGEFESQKGDQSSGEVQSKIKTSGRRTRL